ncbi:uncharacterized protein N7459_007494 [Penicillium hispanicum]|uniref:uncharacterized protein n=1 Tax=Penicillium hispanicum TaxID=1080232 RepID=UPI0025411D7E|nr:uncharacterized protein N7459_007494 [Penicillium hispanicum]KAJ5578530.1 hypothetical protein N7459_007494 [Penicillium hispanicum]
MGIAFGRAGMKDRFTRNKTEKTVSHFLLPTRPRDTWYWLSTTADDIRSLYEDRPVRRQPIYDTIPQNMDAGRPARYRTIPLPLSQCPSLEDIDNFLFHYFSDTCTIRRSLVNYENPWRSVLLPLCFQSEGLLHIAIAWAAHSLRNQCKGDDVSRYDQMILAHKCRSLKYLRNMVSQDSSGQAISLARTRCERDALLLLVMFHCLLEIASGSIMEWTYHMKGAVRIMRYYTNGCTRRRQEIFSQEVLELVYSFFIEKDTFLNTSTASGSEEEEHLDRPQWSTEVPSMFPFLTARGCMKVNPCMGLSPELLDIISCISEQARRRRMSDHNSRDISQAFAIIQHRLIRHKYTPGTSDESGLMELHSAAFEEATWIYFHHAIGDQPRQSEVIQRVHLPRLLKTLEQIHRVHGALLGFIPYPMWALFIASCVVLEEDRVKILEFFTVLKHNKPVSNVPSTMAAVEAIWKRRDFNPEEACTPWTDVISQLGWKMPFT